MGKSLVSCFFLRHSVHVRTRTLIHRHWATTHTNHHTHYKTNKRLNWTKSTTHANCMMCGPSATAYTKFAPHLSQSEFCRTRWTYRAGFGTETSFDLYSTLYFYEILVSTKQVYIPLQLCPISPYTACRSSQGVVNWARQRWTLSVVNWTVVGLLSWQHLRRSTASLSHWSSTARFHRASPSATTGTCNHWRQSPFTE